MVLYIAVQHPRDDEDNPVSVIINVMFCQTNTQAKTRTGRIDRHILKPTIETREQVFMDGLNCNLFDTYLPNLRQKKFISEKKKRKSNREIRTRRYSFGRQTIQSQSTTASTNDV